MVASEPVRPIRRIPAWSTLEPLAGPASSRIESSPASNYLRRWIAHQAGRHVNLLKSIAAAPRPRPS
jgi:hypothetical protein